MGCVTCYWIQKNRLKALAPQPPRHLPRPWRILAGAGGLQASATYPKGSCAWTSKPFFSSSSTSCDRKQKAREKGLLMAVVRGQVQ